MQDGDAAQDQGAHDALAKFGFCDHQPAKPLRLDDERLHRLLRDRVHKRRLAGQQGQFAEKVSRAMDGERLVTVELVVLGHRDLTGEDDHEAGSDLADGPKRFTGVKGAQVPKLTHPLDFEGIERGINLVVPLFANEL